MNSDVEKIINIAKENNFNSADLFLNVQLAQRYEMSLIPFKDFEPEDVFEAAIELKKEEERKSA